MNGWDECILTVTVVLIWYFPKIRVPQYRSQYIRVLIIGTPTRVPLILENPHIAIIVVCIFFSTPAVPA